MSDKLNRRDKRFADEYIISLDAEDAAIKAGFAKSTARTKAYQWVDKGSKLAKDSIIAYIDKKLSEIEDEKIADATEVLQILTAHARRETYDWQITNKGDIVKIITPIKDSIRAAELLGKRYALFTEKVDLDTDITLVFEDDYGDQDQED